jgi:aminopeptidase N
MVSFTRSLSKIPISLGSIKLSSRPYYMNKVSFALIVFLLGHFPVAAQSTPYPDLFPCNKAAVMSNVLQSRGLNTYEDLSFDLTYYRFEWTVDPAVYAIAGKATPYFKAVDNELAIMEFNLSTQLTVDAVKYHGSDIVFTQSGDYGLTVNLPAPLNAGTLDSLSIAYHGVPPSGGFGSFIKSDHNGTPVIWTLSEPFGAQDWWPCKNGLTDKVDSIDVLVTTPSIYRAASNGILLTETIFGTNTIYHWKHQYDIAPYLIAIAVTNYAQFTHIVPLRNGTPMPMLNYVYPENLEDAKTGTADLIQVLQFYDSLLVTYPFFMEKYGHAQFGWGGGMEHQTMSFVIKYTWELLGHELAHQWFGDMVTCGSWEDIWLNEGFATFVEGLTRERFKPDEWWTWRSERLINITSDLGGSVWVDDTTKVNRIFNGRLSYNKGAYLLHMLRWKLGDDVFFGALRSYLNDRRFQFARTAHLKAQLEQTSGEDLTEFFKDWFYGQGFPSYNVSWHGSGDSIFIKVLQKTSHESVEFFEMPLPVTIYGKDGQSTSLRLDHTSNGQVFERELPFKADSVAFDPDLWLLSSSNVVIKDNVFNAFQPVFLSPNPAREEIRVEINDLLYSDARFDWTIYDMAGRLVKTGKFPDGGYTISLRSLPAGGYRLEMVDETGKKAVFPFEKI